MSRIKAKIIAEIGCSHGGSIERAHKLISLAAQSGADIIKFQKRYPPECVPEKWQDKQHPNNKFSYGTTYLNHRWNLELNKKEHALLKAYCETLGTIYSTSVWDLRSAKEIIDLEPKIIKIPSALNTSKEIIDFLFMNHKGEIHISLGMTNRKEKKEILDYLANKCRNIDNYEKIVIYICTSAYPVPAEKLYLLELNDLSYWLEGIKKQWQKGFSDHGCFQEVDIAAYALGANYIERHFIDDKNFRHTDALSSITPKEMLELRKKLDIVYMSLQSKPISIDDIEIQTREKLRPD